VSISLLEKVLKALAEVVKIRFFFEIERGIERRRHAGGVA